MKHYDSGLQIVIRQDFCSVVFGKIDHHQIGARPPMSTLFITESEVEQLITVPDCIEALTNLFRCEVPGNSGNHSRRRFMVPKGVFHFMEAFDLGLGRAAMKVYTSYRPATRFLVLLWDTESGDLLAQIEGNKLGQIRTGAATGVATQYMARDTAEVLAVFGAGWQAETQITAVAAVRRLKRILIYSRTEATRSDFAKKIEKQTGISTIAVNSPDEAIKDADIVVTATTSRTPVFDGYLIKPGTHVNAVGANILQRAEVDKTFVGRCGTIVVDSIEQAKLEAGDLVQAIDGGSLRWEQVVELQDVVSGRAKGRNHEDEITLFKSNGIALEDLAAASLIYDRAEARGVGRPIQLWDA